MSTAAPRSFKKRHRDGALARRDPLVARRLIIQDLHRVAEEAGLRYGDAPGIRLYAKVGSYATTQVCLVLTGKRHGAWREAMAAVHLRTAEARRLTDRDRLIQDIRAVSHLYYIQDPANREPDRLCPFRFYTEKRGTSWDTVMRHVLGRVKGVEWNQVAPAVGLQPSHLFSTSEQARDGFVAAYQDLALRLGMPKGGPGPSAREFKALTPFESGAAWYHFGSWNEFVAAAGFTTRPRGGDQLTKGKGRKNRLGYRILPCRPRVKAKGGTTTTHRYDASGRCVYCRRHYLKLRRWRTEDSP